MVFTPICVPDAVNKDALSVHAPLGSLGAPVASTCRVYTQCDGPRPVAAPEPHPNLFAAQTMTCCRRSA